MQFIIFNSWINLDSLQVVLVFFEHYFIGINLISALSKQYNSFIHSYKLEMREYTNMDEYSLRFGPFSGTRETKRMRSERSELRFAFASDFFSIFVNIRKFVFGSCIIKLDEYVRIFVFIRPSLQKPNIFVMLAFYFFIS